MGQPVRVQFSSPAPFYKNPHEASRRTGLFFYQASGQSDSHKTQNQRFGSLLFRHHSIKTLMRLVARLASFFIPAAKLADSHKIKDFGSLAIRHHLLKTLMRLIARLASFLFLLQNWPTRTKSKILAPWPSGTIL